MSTHIWKKPVVFRSSGDESAFFGWLSAIPSVASIGGVGTELHISFRRRSLPSACLRELLAVYKRYGGDLRELAYFARASNAKWFCNPQAWWFKSVFPQGAPNYSLKRTNQSLRD